MRRGIQAVLVFWFVLVVVALRVGVGSFQAYGEAQQALKNGDTLQARVHLERAAHWYLPGLSPSDQALLDLKSMAEAQARSGETAESLMTWQVLRASLISSRWLFHRNPELLRETNESIAQIRFNDKRAMWPWIDKKPEERLAETRMVLAHDAQPDPAWSLLVVLAYLGWVFGAVGLIFAGFDAAGRLRPRPALLCASVVVAAYGLWVLGMASA